MTDPIRAAAERLLQQLDQRRTGGLYVPLFLVEQAEDELRAALATQSAVTPTPDTNAVLKLAAIIRQVDGSHQLGAAALAEAILAHPAARQVFATPTPPADGETGPSEEEWDALVERVWDAHQTIGHQGERFMWDSDFDRAAAMLRDELTRWGRSTSTTPPADGEAEELAQWLERLADRPKDSPCAAASFDGHLRRAAALLREARPQPVPVAERPWEQSGWSDAEGRCWFGATASGFVCACWTLRKPRERLNWENTSIPHWAIPIPTEPTTTETPNG